MTVPVAFDLVGDWTSARLLVRLLAVVESPWVPLQAGFTHRDTRERVTLSMGPPSRALAEAFAELDWRLPTIDDALLAGIAQHRAVVSVSLAGEGEPLARARTVLRAADAVVSAGALAVRCRTSGRAHGADPFRELVARVDAAGPRLELALALFPAFVVVDPLRDRPCTLGMHALGFPDLELAAAGEPHADAARLEDQALALLRGSAPVGRPDDRPVAAPVRNPLGLFTP